MATAQRIVQDAKRIVEFVTEERVRMVPQVDRIRLDISIEEAETLAILSYQTGGNPHGRRGDIDNIRRALSEANIVYSGYTGHPDLLTSVRFSPVRSRGGLSASNRWTPLSSEQATQGNNAKQADCNPGSDDAKTTIPWGGRFPSPLWNGEQ